MRIVACVLAVLGALAGLAAGALGLAEQQSARHQSILLDVRTALHNAEVPEESRADARRVAARYHTLPFLLLASGVLGLVGGFLALDGRRAAAAMLLLLAAAGPLAFASRLALTATASVPGHGSAVGVIPVVLNRPQDSLHALELAAAPGLLLTLAGLLTLLIRRGLAESQSRGSGTVPALLGGLVLVLYLGALAAVWLGTLDELLVG
jgi:hypothetical protein